MARGKSGFGNARVPAKIALSLAVMWDLIGGGLLYFGLDSEPMSWKDWLRVGGGAVMILVSGYYWILFARQRRDRP